MRLLLRLISFFCSSERSGVLKSVRHFSEQNFLLILFAWNSLLQNWQFFKSWQLTDGSFDAWENTSHLFCFSLVRHTLYVKGNRFEENNNEDLKPAKLAAFRT